MINLVILIKKWWNVCNVRPFEKLKPAEDTQSVLMKAAIDCGGVLRSVSVCRGLAQKHRPLVTVQQIHNTTGRFCSSKVLLPTCPYWWKLAHSDYIVDARVLGVTYVTHSHFVCRTMCQILKVCLRYVEIFIDNFCPVWVWGCKQVVKCLNK